MKVKNDNHNQLEEDFYIDENGMLVMTASFHKKRGFCCGNLCKHCPYIKPSKRGNTELEK